MSATCGHHIIIHCLAPSGGGCVFISLLLSRLPSRPEVKFMRRVSASRKTRLRERAMMLAISRDASILRSSRKAGDVARASPRSSAALASPFAAMMRERLSCSAYWTRYLARSACCWAICFSSMAFWNSLPKRKSLMETSSSTMLKSLRRSAKLSRIFYETCSR